MTTDSDQPDVDVIWQTFAATLSKGEDLMPELVPALQFVVRLDRAQFRAVLYGFAGELRYASELVHLGFGAGSGS